MMERIAGSVIPPKSGDQEGQHRWQWAVFMKLWLLILFAVWGLDLIPGFPGLARASEVQALSVQLEAYREESLESKMFDLRIKQCEEGIPVALRQAYGEQLTKLMTAYHEATGRIYSLTSCSDLR